MRVKSKFVVGPLPLRVRHHLIPKRMSTVFAVLIPDLSSTYPSLPTGLLQSICFQVCKTTVLRKLFVVLLVLQAGTAVLICKVTKENAK